MAQNQNSSFLNHFDSAFGDKTINSGQILSLQSNFNKNYVNGSGSISSARALSNPMANAIGFQHQNGHIFQNTHLDVAGYGHQRVFESINEVRRTLIASSRLQTANFVDGGFHMQNQHLGSFSDVVRNTQLLLSTSIMERLLAQGNGTLPFQSHSNFGNQRLLALNQANRRPTENKYSFSSIYHNHQNNSIIRETPTTIDLGKNIDHQIDHVGVALNKPPTTSSVCASSQVQGQSPSLTPNPSPKLNPTFDLQDIKIHRNSRMGEPSRNPISISIALNNQRTSQTDNNDSNDEAIEYDGVTHSLRRKKDGSFICPKCKAVSSSSQKFASHVKSHYRSESPAERRKRLAAKIKKRNKNKFRLFHSRDGLTVVPVNN